MARVHVGMSIIFMTREILINRNGVPQYPNRRDTFIWYIYKQIGSYIKRRGSRNKRMKQKKSTKEEDGTQLSALNYISYIIMKISSTLNSSFIKRTVLLETCIFGDKLYTKHLTTAAPLVFHEKFKYKKELDKKLTLPCLIELFKDSVVIFNLLEVTRMKNSCQSQMNILATKKLPASIFFFPPSYIQKYHTVKMFPFKDCQPILKFWVDAIIYRSSSCFLLSQVTKLRQSELMKELKSRNADRCVMPDADSLCHDDNKCVICKSYLKYLGRPYCAHKQPNSKLGRTGGRNDCDDDYDTDDFCRNNYDNGDDDDECNCSNASGSKASHDGDDDGRRDSDITSASIKQSYPALDLPQKCSATSCSNICRASSCIARGTKSRSQARKRVEFWLAQLQMLTCKPVDEFTNVLRNIYVKEYSRALRLYNSFVCKK
ncbi:hypothetical protein HELRODRAFT_188450 [Helobdella robusta]|uniref:Uncharacterized protein n=1 Tax=Helobdella robusta TaxID=6412 RepID=T1FQ01_HELRO|nr:hypothetical protein HELRODRAFT_188450 [Helobdella robusta]ESO06686.1 hypothetical protein HELRODRAFT_188450 [Helobdella robusta]